MNAIGFGLSNELTVYAAYDDRHLKMVGVLENADRESRYKTKPEEPITFDDVKQAWESPDGTESWDSPDSSGGSQSIYRVKDISPSCSSGN